VRTGGVEPPQPEATGLQPAGLSGAQRPQGGRAAARRYRSTSASMATKPAASAAATRCRPSRTTKPPPSRASRTGGASRPCSSHSRYRSTVTASIVRRRRAAMRTSSSGIQRVTGGRVCACGSSSHSADKGVGRPDSNRYRRGSRPRVLAVTPRPPGDDRLAVGDGSLVRWRV